MAQVTACASAAMQIQQSAGSAVRTVGEQESLKRFSMPLASRSPILVLKRFKCAAGCVFQSAGKHFFPAFIP
ncbi:MAG: hypothetical protein K2J53_02020, partial [Alistipes sp.]|nr:hypothetical protein [Alistipes sp.]